MNIFDEIRKTLSSDLNNEKIISLGIDKDFLSNIKIKENEFCYDNDYFSGYTDEYRNNTLEEQLDIRKDSINWNILINSVKLRPEFIEKYWPDYSDITIEAIIDNQVISDNLINLIVQHYSNYGIKVVCLGIKKLIKTTKISEDNLNIIIESSSGQYSSDISRYQELSSNFIIDNIKFLDLVNITIYQKLSIDVIIKLIDCLDFPSLLTHQNSLNEENIIKYWGKIRKSKKLIECISKFNKLSENFIDNYGSELDWEKLSINNKIDLNILIKYKHLIFWSKTFDRFNGNFIRLLTADELDKLIKENIFTEKDHILYLLNFIESNSEKVKFFEKYPYLLK